MKLTIERENLAYLPLNAPKALREELTRFGFTTMELEDTYAEAILETEIAKLVEEKGEEQLENYQYPTQVADTIKNTLMKYYTYNRGRLFASITDLDAQGKPHYKAMLDEITATARMMSPEYLYAISEFSKDAIAEIYNNAYFVKDIPVCIQIGDIKLDTGFVFPYRQVGKVYLEICVHPTEEQIQKSKEVSIEDLILKVSKRR